MLDQTLKAIRPVSEEARLASQQRQLQLTKPPGSLGVLETIGNTLSAIAGACPPPVPAAPVVGLFAGDHGVCAQGVTPWPQEVTVQMVLNIASGGAAINALARQIGADVWVTNVGVASDVPQHPAVRDRLVRRGTSDLTVEPAMTREEAIAALEVGIATANEAVDGGADCLLTGEMGIGNTTPAAALVAASLDLRGADVAGRGTGLDDESLARKAALLDEALSRVGDRAIDPRQRLAALGSADIAAAVGFIAGAAARGVPVVVDGLIASAEALRADELFPGTRAWLVAGHRSTEPGCELAQTHLGLEPVLDLGMRLGEGSGAVLAVGVLHAAVAALREVALLSEI